MDIASVMTEITTIQGACETDDFKVKKAYDYPPAIDEVIAPDACPVFLNEWSFDREDRITNGAGEEYYTVHMLFLVFDGNFRKACEIATSFLPVILRAFDATESLNGSCFWSKLRGASPTLTPWRRNEHLYAALNLLLDVKLVEGRSFGP